MKINIMGTEYEYFRDDLNNPELSTSDGYCMIYDKAICVRERRYLAGESEKAKMLREEHVIRHEVVHAIAEETGVEYGENEALVDWIAKVIPHVNKALEDIKNGDE